MLQVLDFELQRQLVPYMKDLTPLPGIYNSDFIAANQDARADNLIKGSKRDQVHPETGGQCPLSRPSFQLVVLILTLLR